MSSNSNLPIPSFNFMDGLWDSMKVAKLIYFILCFDVLFFLLKGYGFFGIKLGREFDLSFADFAGMVIVFGIFSSIILKIIVFLFIQCLISLRFSRLFKNDNSNSYQKTDGYVSIYALREDALDDGDDLSLKLYFEEKNKMIKSLNESSLNEAISLGIFLIFMFEWYFSNFDGSSRMFIDWLWGQLVLRDPTIEHHSVGLVISIFLSCYTLMICWPRDNYYSIYYPRLAEKLRKKDADRRIY